MNTPFQVFIPQYDNTDSICLIESDPQYLIGYGESLFDVLIQPGIIIDNTENSDTSTIFMYA